MALLLFWSFLCGKISGMISKNFLLFLAYLSATKFGSVKKFFLCFRFEKRGFVVVSFSLHHPALVKELWAMFLADCWALFVWSSLAPCFPERGQFQKNVCCDDEEALIFYAFSVKWRFLCLLFFYAKSFLKRKKKFLKYYLKSTTCSFMQH